jgi:hypothetical protein
LQMPGDASFADEARGDASRLGNARSNE